MNLPRSVAKGVLRIGGHEVECDVLDNGYRVLVTGQVDPLFSGNSQSPGKGHWQRSLARIHAKLEDISNPPTTIECIQFIHRDACGRPAHGYKATTLLDECLVIHEANSRGVLHPSQARLAAGAFDFIAACAKTGIVALIDEATGYQQVRPPDAIRQTFEANSGIHQLVERKAQEIRLLSMEVDIRRITNELVTLRTKVLDNIGEGGAISESRWNALRDEIHKQADLEVSAGKFQSRTSAISDIYQDLRESLDFGRKGEVWKEMKATDERAVRAVLRRRWKSVTKKAKPGSDGGRPPSNGQGKIPFKPTGPKAA